MDFDREAAAFRTICSSIVQMTEGGVPYVLLRDIRLDLRGKAEVLDALICLQASTWGYPTKLLLSRKVGNPNLNWNAQPVIFGKTWHTWSWTGVEGHLPLMEIFLSHAGALK